MAEIVPPPHDADRHIDVTGEMCPMSFVRVKLVLEAMQPGQVLEVRLRDGEALANVPRSSAEAGHVVLDLVPAAPGTHRLRLRRGADAVRSRR